jgi:rod shape-determining protein MreC
MTFARRRWTPLKTLVAVAGLVLLSGLLPISFKCCARKTLVCAQAPLWLALRDVDQLEDAAALKSASRDELIEMVTDMAHAQAGLELKLKMTVALEEEKARLEDLLKMPPYWGYDARAARIIRRDLNAWWQEIWIDRGASSGVRPGLGVVCRDGVVGRVSEVYDQMAVVELLTSPRFRMAARLEGDTRPFVYTGAGLRFGLSPLGLAQAMQPENALADGVQRVVVTTGLSGSFPEGMPVGTLFKTDGLSSGGLLEGKIRPAAALDGLREVTVLLPNR